MLDEHYNVQGASVDIDRSIIKTEEETKGENKYKSETVNIVLTSNGDTMYKDIRDLNFGALFKVFNKKLKEFDDIMKDKDKA